MSTAEQAPRAWLTDEVGRQLAADLVAQACQRYRLSEDEAQPIVLDVLAKSTALREAVLAGHDAQQIQRTRAFRELSSATRKQIYYHLRRYDRASLSADEALAQLDAMEPGTRPGHRLLAQLTSGHVSTLERLPDLEAFHEALFAHCGLAASVLDVGCGVYPVLFPFDGAGAAVGRYVAADKDPASVRILEGYARVRGDGRLRPVCFDINDGWPAFSGRTGIARFDLAFLFKLVSMLRRQDRRAYEILMRVPADRVVLSGATKSMTKNRSIERRERATLLDFAKAAGLSVVAESQIADEYLIAASRIGSRRAGS